MAVTTREVQLHGLKIKHAMIRFATLKSRRFMPNPHPHTRGKDGEREMGWKLPQDYRRLKQPQRREVRLQYIVEQDGKCAHCQSDLAGSPRADIDAKPIRWSLFPGGEGFLRHPIHLHHDHKTGMTIGAVHAYCNAVLWQYHKE